MWRHYVNELDNYHNFKNFKIYWAYRQTQKERVESDVSSIRIDNLLKDNGWICDNKDFKYYSSLGDISRVWMKNGKTVITGLNVKGYPPNLIKPIPKEASDKMDEYNLKEYVNETYNYKPEDPFISDWIQNKTDEQIVSWLESI